MTVKAKNQLKSFATMLSLGGVLVVAVGLIYLFFTPKVYQSSVRIRMRNWANSTNDVHSDFDIGAECQAVRSDSLLDESIKNLGLNELWGKRFNQSIPLKPEQSRILLKSKTNVRPVPKSSLMQIQVASDDRDETAVIANEIARLYLAKRQAQHQALNAERLAQFRQKWEEKGQKVQEAQAALDKLYLDITRDRTTNPATMYDLIQAKRVEWEGHYIEQRDQLAMLKAMSQEQLKRALPTFETDTNSLLTAALTQRSKARTDLIIAQSSYAAGSPELKHAALVVDELDKTIARTIAGIMTAREDEVASLKSAVDDMDEKMKRAGANRREMAVQDSNYAKARQNLENLKLERDDLQQKMEQEESHNAIIPTAVLAEIIDSAETPKKPVTPDGKIAASTIGAGSFAMVAGLILLFMSQKPKPVPRNN